MTLFAQISDLHIDNKVPELSHIDSRANALAALNDVQKQNIRQIIFSGDIAESMDGLHWFLQQVREREFEFEVIPGNHDEALSMIEQSAFDGIKTYRSMLRDGFLMLFLDSGSNSIDPKQLSWIDEQLSHASNEVLVFVHHPVLNCGDSVMDKKYPLENRDDVLKIFRKAARKISIFSGHYHREDVIEYENIIQYVTPSAFYQIKKYAPKIEIESEAIGYRVLSLDNGKYETQVKYVEVINPSSST